MPLGLRRLAKAIACAAVLAAVGKGAVATAVDQGDSWTVTVGPASRALYPGTDATMAYEVRNATSHSLHLQGTTAVVRVRGGVDGCRDEWFRVGSNSVPTDVDVAPGEIMQGSLVLVFDDAPVSQDACQNVGLDVVVTAS